MKKFLSVLISFAIIISLATVTFAASPKGDLNGDGKTTSADALVALQYSVGQLKTIDKTKADLNKDNKVNSADALEILQICVGKSPAFDVPSSANGIVSFYCNTLKNTYNKSKLTIKYTYTESGKLYDLTAKTNTPYSDSTTKTREYKNGIDKITGADIDEFNPGYGFDAAGVSSATMTKKADGNYLVTLVLKEEKTVGSKAPNYNTKAAFGFIFGVDDASVSYTGTTLQLTVDSFGNALGLVVKMPFICEYKELVNSKTHSFKATGSYDYTATYIY